MAVDQIYKWKKGGINMEKGTLIQRLIELVFEKAEMDSKETTPNGLSEYLRDKLVDENYSERISERTFNRYYEDYIPKKENERITPNGASLNILSRYLGYVDFEDFIRKKESEIKKEKEGYEEDKSKYKERLLVSLIFNIVLLFILGIFVSKYYKKNCMIWVDDHYEKIRCSGLDTERKLDEVILENLRKVTVCDTTTFFKNGEPVIHYLKYKNQIEFFTYHGEHPIYEGKFLDPITETIINGHVKPCDSIITQITCTEAPETCFYGFGLALN